MSLKWVGITLLVLAFIFFFSGDSDSLKWQIYGVPANVTVLEVTTSAEVPNSANPTTDAEGEVAYDTNDDALEIFDGSNSRLINSDKMFAAVFSDPEGLQSIQDDWTVLPVEAYFAPHGITLTHVGIKTSASSTYSVVFQEWTSPTAFGSNIETVATSSSTEAEDDGSIDDANIAAGSIIRVDLPTTDITELTVWGTFYINDGN